MTRVRVGCTITILRVSDGQWSTATKDRQHQKKIHTNVILMAIWDVKGIVHLEFMPKDTTINSEHEVH